LTEGVRGRVCERLTERDCVRESELKDGNQESGKGGVSVRELARRK